MDSVKSTYDPTNWPNAVGIMTESQYRRMLRGDYSCWEAK